MRQVVIHARVWEEYAPLVRQKSKFWNAGGLDLHLGLFTGVQITAASPRTVVSGGIAFASPPESRMPATDGTTFDLYEKLEPGWTEWTPVINLHLPQQALHTNTPPGSYLK